MDETQIGNLIITLAAGLIFCTTGFLMKRNPPKMINGLYGYRTKRSMKSQSLWDEANTYSSEIMFKYGLVFTIVGVVLSLLFKGIFIALIILGLLLVFVTFMFIKVEKRLKAMDDES